MDLILQNYNYFCGIVTRSYSFHLPFLKITTYPGKVSRYSTFIKLFVGPKCHPNMRGQVGPLTSSIEFLYMKALIQLILLVYPRRPIFLAVGSAGQTAQVVRVPVIL